MAGTTRKVFTPADDTAGGRLMLPEGYLCTAPGQSQQPAPGFLKSEELSGFSGPVQAVSGR